MILFLPLVFIFSASLLLGQNPFPISVETCQGPIKMNIYHTIEPADDCGELELNFSYEIVQGQDIFMGFDSVLWGDFNNLGEYVWQWTYNHPVYLTPVSIQKIDLHIAFTVLCDSPCSPCAEDHHFTIPNDWESDNMVCVSYCSSAISYCDMMAPVPDVHKEGFNKVMGEIVGFKYNTSNGTSIDVYQDQNNAEGIFHFPYYTHVSQQCGYPPNIYHFAEDMNKFLNLANTSNNPNYDRFFGTAQWAHTYGVNGDLCKLNLFFVNTGVRITLLWVDQYEFNKPECLIGDLFIPEMPANLNPNFPVVDDCFYNLGHNEMSNLEIDNNPVNKSDKYALYQQDQKANEIFCYPTFTNDFVNIVTGDALKIELIDINGRLLFSKKMLSLNNKITFDIRKYNKGLYFLRIRNEETNSTYIEKVLKQ